METRPGVTGRSLAAISSVQQRNYCSGSLERIVTTLSFAPLVSYSVFLFLRQSTICSSFLCSASNLGEIDSGNNVKMSFYVVLTLAFPWLL